MLGSFILFVLRHIYVLCDDVEESNGISSTLFCTDYRNLFMISVVGVFFVHFFIFIRGPPDSI